jgi:Flp pilus assembly protein protease CpaA
MTALDLLGDPLVRAVVMTIWLLPCALQDYRTRQVSNWLTVPLFLAAWPIAALTGNLLLALATFIGVYAAFRSSGGGFGAADGKVAVGLAAILPPALLVGTLVQALAFGYLKLRRKSVVRLPGVTGYFIGALLVALVLIGEDARLRAGSL